MKLTSELSRCTSILCQADASMASLLAEEDAEKAAESSKASRKKNKKKKKGVQDSQPVSTYDLRTKAFGLSSIFTCIELIWAGGRFLHVKNGLGGNSAETC